jgi:hypothetical protein
LLLCEGPQPSEKRGRRGVDLYPDFGDLTGMSSSWRFLGSALKMGEIVSYFEYFDLGSWFEIWVSGKSYLKAF